ncbi:hypothetical protein LCM17_04710 [Cereibacter sphaeroides]|nr:hypothetical protein [Cereibacter sphaeroides]
MWRVVLSLFLLALAACAFPVPPVGPGPATRGQPLDRVLAPFEDSALLPAELRAIPYAPGRAYALLVLLPSPGAVDLSDPGRAQRGLAAFLNPLAILRAGTSVGHVMVGWHCAGGQAGLTSKTGDSQGRGYRMLRQGWGMGALLATYDDGHLLMLDAMPARHRRALRTGQARIVAVEIAESRCQRMRRALAGYLARPQAERGHYTLVPSAEHPLGDACASFALWLAGEGGAVGALPRALLRPVTLRDSFVGLGLDPGPGLMPLQTEATRPLSLTRLLTTDWAGGATVGQVQLLDMELLQLALERAEMRAGHPRLLRIPLDNPATQSALIAAEGWVARWPLAEAFEVGQARGVLLGYH